MDITRNSNGVSRGPVERFVGDVYVETIATPTGPSSRGAAVVRFTPDARTAWHSYPLGQTLFVLEGVGPVQRRGGPIEIIRPGDRICTEPGEEHWHGATSASFMAQLALQQYDDDGIPAMWGELVTEEEYAKAPTN